MLTLLVSIISISICCCIYHRRKEERKQSESPEVIVKGYSDREEKKEWLAFSKRRPEQNTEGKVKPLRNLSEESDLSRSMILTRSLSEDVFTSRSGNHSYA